MPQGNPRNVRVGPGWLYFAPLDTPEPTDLDTPWETVDPSWVQVGYTDTGSSFVFNTTAEDVMVAEELDPIETLETSRVIDITFAAAELTAQNMQLAFNGGEVETGTGIVVFEPPPTGDSTPIMIGWESDDGLERWVYRRCRQVGSVTINRQRVPNKATLPLTFRATKPANDEHGDPVKPFKFIHAEEYELVGS